MLIWLAGGNQCLQVKRLAVISNIWFELPHKGWLGTCQWTDVIFGVVLTGRLALFFTIFAQAWSANKASSLAHCTEVREIVSLLYSHFGYKALWLTCFCQRCDQPHPLLYSTTNLKLGKLDSRGNTSSRHLQHQFTLCSHVYHT